MSARTLIRDRARRVWVALLLCLPFGTALPAQQPTVVSGVVIDADSDEPIAGVEVRIAGTPLLAVTDDEGRFRLSGVPRGGQRFVLRHIAYGEHERVLVLEEGGAPEYLVRMSRGAIELEPIVVEVEPSYTDRVFRAGGNPANIIDAETIDAADRTGMSLMSLLQREVPGIRFRNGNCIEYRFQAGGSSIGVPMEDDPPEPANLTCRELAVYMDGVRMQESASLLLDMYLGQLERVEVLSPGQAGVRYGQAGARGVLLLETKQGNVPEVGPDRVAYTGFGWFEERPYAWPRVLGVSLLTNAAAAAMTFGVVMDCRDEDPAYIGETTCVSTFAVGAGLVTGTVGGLLTSWAGRSSLTQGRTFPLMLVGTASSMTSYLLLMRAQENDSSLGGVGGVALASLGTSLLMTLTDRIFRVSR